MTRDAVLLGEEVEDELARARWVFVVEADGDACALGLALACAVVVAALAALGVDALLLAVEPVLAGDVGVVARAGAELEALALALMLVLTLALASALTFVLGFVLVQSSASASASDGRRRRMRPVAPASNASARSDTARVALVWTSRAPERSCVACDASQAARSRRVMAQRARDEAIVAGREKAMREACGVRRKA